MAKEYQNEKFNELNAKFDSLLKRSIDEGNYIPFFAYDYFDYNISSMSELSLIQYYYDLNNFFHWLLEQRRFDSQKFKKMTPDILDSLTIEDINSYKKTLIRIKSDDGTIRESSKPYRARKISSLRSFLKYMALKGYGSQNLVQLIKIPEVPKGSPKALNSSETRRLLEAVDNYPEKRKDRPTKLRDKAIITTLLGTGMRVSELVGIDISDIDFYEDEILIVRKGGDKDKVFMPQEVELAITDYINNQRCNIKNSLNSPALFLNYNGDRLPVRSVQMLIDKYSKFAGINDNITPHTLRRTFGTNVYRETGDLKMVRDSLHHKSVQTSLDHYVESSEDEKSKLDAAVGAIFDRQEHK